VLLWWSPEREVPRANGGPTGGRPEPYSTNTQESHASALFEDSQARTAINATQIIGRRTQNGATHTTVESTGQITTREVWKLIRELKDIINHQTTLIE
jgi:hypothetical protein